MVKVLVDADDLIQLVKRAEELAKLASKLRPKRATERSSVMFPINFVWEFLGTKGANMTRKEALDALVAAGVNYHTAKTQWYRWSTGRKMGTYQ